MVLSRVQRLQASTSALDQSGNVLSRWRRNQSAHGAALFNPSIPHHDHFVGKASCFSQVMRHEQSRNREVPAQRVECLLKIGARDCVERTERLIEQHDTRSRCDTARQSHTLTLATRQFMREPRPKRRRGESYQLQCVPRCIVSVAHFLERRNESDVPQYAPVRKEATVLLHVPYLPSQQNWRLGANILVANSHFTALRLDQAIEAAQKSGLAGSTFADQRYRFPRRNVDTDVIERLHPPEPVGHIPRS
jgi:hypothetical protein